EEITWMLTIKRCNQLSCKQVFKRNDVGFCKTEGLFDGLRNSDHRRLVHDTAQDRGDFNLHLCSFGHNKQSQDSAIVDVFGYASAGHYLKYRRSDPLHGSVNISKCLRPVVDRQIHEIDVNGKARQVAYKEI